MSSFTCSCGIKHVISIYPIVSGGSDSSAMSFPEVEEGSLNTEIMEAYNEQKVKAKKATKAKKAQSDVPPKKRARKSKKADEVAHDVAPAPAPTPAPAKKKRGRPSKQVAVSSDVVLEV